MSDRIYGLKLYSTLIMNTRFKHVKQLIPVQLTKLYQYHIYHAIYWYETLYQNVPEYSRTNQLVQLDLY